MKKFLSPIFIILIIFIINSHAMADSPPCYITQWGSQGTGNGQFYDLWGIAADSSGDVYVADTLNSRIQEFSDSGTYITQWGSAGSGNGQFNGPDGIAVDGSGNVYVSDDGNTRIEKFHP